MLHPNQFEVNEAWIAFRLNGTPVRTEVDGDFNCIALMDAASCFILGMEMVSTSAKELDQRQCHRLFEVGRSHKQQLPTTLIVAREDVADILTTEAKQLEIDVVRVPASSLVVFVGEARQSFAERFESDRGDA